MITRTSTRLWLTTIYSQFHFQNDKITIQLMYHHRMPIGCCKFCIVHSTHSYQPNCHNSHWNYKMEWPAITNEKYRLQMGAISVANHRTYNNWTQLKQSGALHWIHEMPQNSQISKLQLIQSVAWIADGFAQKRQRRDTFSLTNFEFISIKLIWPSPIKQIFSPNSCHFVNGCATSPWLDVFISIASLLLLLLLPFPVDLGFAFWNNNRIVLSIVFERQRVK